MAGAGYDERNKRIVRATITVESIMIDKEMEYRWATVASKQKTMTVSEMIHNQEAGIPYNPGDLRDYLVQRVMARHGFTEEQALAEILAFGGSVD